MEIIRDFSTREAANRQRELQLEQELRIRNLRIREEKAKRLKRKRILVRLNVTLSLIGALGITYISYKDTTEYKDHNKYVDDIGIVMESSTESEQMAIILTAIEELQSSDFEKGFRRDEINELKSLYLQIQNASGQEKYDLITKALILSSKVAHVRVDPDEESLKLG